jgi:hypothetical protein
LANDITSFEALTNDITSFGTFTSDITIGKCSK